MLCQQHKTQEKKLSFRDILFDGDNWEKHKRENQPSSHVLETVDKLRKCRTEELGYHFWHCKTCGYGGKSPHSCKSKLCSSCSTIATHKWLAEVLPTLLDTKYFQIVFTLPPTLFPIFVANKKILYNLFFEVASQTIMLVAASMAFEPGAVAVFHPFGSEYNVHPHIHFMVTAGGLTLNHQGWFPVLFWPLEQTRSTFKALLYKKLRKLVNNNKVFNPYGSFYDFDEVLQKLYLKTWNLFIGYKDGEDRARFGLSYISRYAKRAIISDRNLLHYDGEFVTFKSKNKRITMKTDSFIKRVLKHLLPKYFKTTRFYGIYSNRKRKQLVPRAKKLAKFKPIKTKGHLNWRERKTKYNGLDPLICPYCGKELTLIEVTHSSRIPTKWKGILTLSTFDHFL